MKVLNFDPSRSASQILRVQNTVGRPVTMKVYWSGRGECWYLDVTYQETVESTPVTILGLKLLPKWLPLRGLKATFPFPGDFLLLPASREDAANEPGYDDLGSRWRLCLLTQAEADAWAVANGLR